MIKKMLKVSFVFPLLLISVGFASSWQTRVYGAEFKNCYVGFDLKHRAYAKNTRNHVVTLILTGKDAVSKRAFLVCNSKEQASNNVSACSVGRLNVNSGECWHYHYDKNHNKCSLQLIACHSS